MKRRTFANRLPCPPPVAEGIPTPVAPGSISPSHSVISAAAPSMTAEEEATRQKKRKAKPQKKQVEVPVAPSPPPSPPVIPEPKLVSPRLLAPETLSSELDLAVRGNLAAEPPLSDLVEEAGGKEKKKLKRRKHGEEAASPSQSTVTGAPIFVGEDKAANVVAPAPEQGKRKRRRVKEEEEQSSRSPLPFDVHPQGGKDAAEDPKCENVAVRSSSKKPRMPSNHEIIMMTIEEMKQQPPEDILDAVRKAVNPSTSSTENNYSSPWGPFLGEFSYKPDRQQNHDSPPFPQTPDRPARLLPRDRVSSEPSQLGGNGTFNAAVTPILNASVSLSQEAVHPKDKDNEKLKMKMNGKKQREPPRDLVSSEPSQLGGNGTSKATKTPILTASVSLSQEAVHAKDNEKLNLKMKGKKQTKPKPLFNTPEKRSDKYRRIPLDQLVPPPRSPHKLLQEKHASDPWKVIVICMLLNLTQGKQVKKIVKGFFKRYPDPQTACHADTQKMIEYLRPLGLQEVKAKRIQKFSKQYVEKEWTHITELCGVGKYAADAYAIFCAGKATEVVPADHKLVDYWKYVCFELPLIQGPENAQEPGMTDQLGELTPN